MRSERQLAKLREVMEKCQDKKLDFLCFPEAFLCGYTEKAILEYAVSLDDPELCEFFEWSGRFDTVFIIGINERRKEGIYNSQLVLYKGGILGVSHKTVLTGGDKNITLRTCRCRYMRQRAYVSAW